MALLLAAALEQANSLGGALLALPFFLLVRLIATWDRTEPTRPLEPIPFQARGARLALPHTASLRAFHAEPLSLLFVTLALAAELETPLLLSEFVLMLLLL